MEFDLPVEEKLGDDVDMDTFTELLQETINVYRDMVMEAIEEIREGECDG